MNAWIDNTLDELDARLRELKREVSRREWEASWLEDRGLSGIHDLDALRRPLSRSAASDLGDSIHRARPVPVPARAA